MDTETAAPMHLGAQGASGVRCDWCPAIFTPKRRWARFCGSACRNAYHAATKPAAVREARELVRAALAGGGTSEEWKVRARKLLGIKG